MLIKLKRWFSRPLKCKLGFHVFSWDEWSRGYCCWEHFNKISFHCKRCQKIIKTLAPDDIPEDIRNHILFISKELSSNLDFEANL